MPALPSSAALQCQAGSMVHATVAVRQVLPAPPACRLAARGLALRADSRLCQQYIEEGQLSLRWVVNVMDEMRFYFAHTDYDDRREELKEVGGLGMGWGLRGGGEAFRLASACFATTDY